MNQSPDRIAAAFHVRAWSGKAANSTRSVSSSARVVACMKSGCGHVLPSFSPPPPSFLFRVSSRLSLRLRPPDIFLLASAALVCPFGKLIS